ncbi:MAG TPA: hypothetical protein VG274_13195 [Rhizomicrobium sp.]|nr:hypothetical protein [Rhizomicrobium sp.]
MSLLCYDYIQGKEASMSNGLRFDTLATLAGASIPDGTESVVIEQFDLCSADSAARYIPVETNPGHDLSVLNAPGNGWWAVHPDHLSLEAAGAPADISGDCASAMQRVLGYLAAATRAKLQLHERDYVLNSRAALAQSSGDPPLSLTIMGRGRDASRLLVHYPDNQAGALALAFADTRSEFVARDFSVIATGATGPGGDCGTGIRIGFPESADTGAAHGAVIANLFVGGEDERPNGAGDSFFSKPIDIAGASRPLVSGCRIGAPAGPDAMAGEPGELGPLPGSADATPEGRGL